MLLNQRSTPRYTVKQYQIIIHILNIVVYINIVVFNCGWRRLLTVLDRQAESYIQYIFVNIVVYCCSRKFDFAACRACQFYHSEI